MISFLFLNKISGYPDVSRYFVIAVMSMFDFDLRNVCFAFHIVIHANTEVFLAAYATEKCCQQIISLHSEN